VGEEKVDGVDCNVWRLARDHVTVDVYTAQEETVNANRRLRKMVIRDVHGTREHATTYFNFDIEFNASIESDTFEVPNLTFKRPKRMSFC
jgi:hypothetical protein